MGTDDRTDPGLPQRRTALPVRTSRSRRPGRHSSPHLLSVPPGAPALVIGIPGAASRDSDEIAAEVMAGAGASCPGIPVLAGYLEGGSRHLGQVLRDMHGHDGRPAVVVPLLAGPHTGADAAIGQIAANAGFPVLVAGHLGPHPLLAEALHARLAEDGLARTSRAGRLSIVAEAGGVIVGAVGGEGAAQAAGVAAVLLASRLTLPVVPASLTDPGGLGEAADRLRVAQVSRIVLAPCVIGPELPPDALGRLAAVAGMRCARPLGAHPAVGKLVAMRYGSALEDPALAGLAG